MVIPKNFLLTILETGRAIVNIGLKYYPCIHCTKGSYTTKPQELTDKLPSIKFA